MGVWSEFTNLVEKCWKWWSWGSVVSMSHWRQSHVSTSSKDSQIQWKIHTYGKQGDFLLFYPFLPACSPTLSIPLRSSVMQVLVPWASALAHGKWWDCMAKNHAITVPAKKEFNFPLAKVSYVSSRHLLRLYVPLMQTAWPKPEIAQHINLSTEIILRLFKASVL